MRELVDRLLLDEQEEAVLGPVDAQKLRSSMTLFAHVTDDPVFRQVLEQYFAGALDDATTSRL